MFTTNDKGEAYEKGTLHCGALETYIVQHPAGRFGDFISFAYDTLAPEA